MPSPSLSPWSRFKIRATKWLSRRLPPKLVHRLLARNSTIPHQAIFREAFRLADPSKTALDIGANRGIVSWYMARRFARLHSFEPNAELAAFLARVLPSHCTVHACALSDAPGESELSLALESGIPIHGRGRILETPSPRGDYAVQKIRLETLDDQDIRDVGFIKIDVEGHEDKVIRGGMRMLREQRPILVIEIERRHTGKPSSGTLAWIESLGYQGFFFEGDRRRPVSEFEDRMQDPDAAPYVNDFLFLPSGSAAG